ncbi:CD1247 N-terminal domain-containing protein [Haloimpatiens sp. FM7315]|uniref:CD1247 N-terminal domain-containing protein n=1 Tax=Haloimpatiens sp. FM7315 TaxID=3298609 RepID=UPI0035A2DFCA
MNSVNEKVSYLKGLVHGLNINENTNEGKAIVEIVKILDAISDELNETKKSYVDLKEYIEQIDSDLTNVEDEIYGLSDELLDEGSEYDEENFEEVKCPSCDESVYIDKSLFGSSEHIECPNCRYGIVLNSSSSVKTE